MDGLRVECSGFVLCGGVAWAIEQGRWAWRALWWGSVLRDDMWWSGGWCGHQEVKTAAAIVAAGAAPVAGSGSRGGGPWRWAVAAVAAAIFVPRPSLKK